MAERIEQIIGDITSLRKEIEQVSKFRETLDNLLKEQTNKIVEIGKLFQSMRTEYKDLSIKQEDLKEGLNNQRKILKENQEKTDKKIEDLSSSLNKTSEELQKLMKIKTHIQNLVKELMG